MRILIRSTLLLAAFLLLLASETLAGGGATSLPAPGMVTMVDLGANSCIPCKMMAPILEELKSEYQGKAAIVFIDVWKMPEQAKKFQVSVIPTQVFYDKSGVEVYRHVGFLEKQAIVDQLAKMGVPQPVGGSGN
ncbi:MAG: thioredoxin family protein [Thermodesulfobacteriota bacterium]